jgi:anti-anti-sigma factor
MTVPPFSNHALSGNAIAEVIPVNYELVRGSETQALRELLPRVKQESIALNLSGVERIDAAGIATLITLYCSSVEAGRDFSVVAPSPHVLELLQIVGLDAILMAGSRQVGSRAECLACPAA